MPDQPKKKSNFSALLIVIVAVLIAATMWKLTQRRSPEQQVAKLTEKYSNGELTVEGAPTLQQIARKARTWQPAFTQWYGKTAPDFTLTDTDGNTHKLSDYRGKAVTLIFWATWCGPCISEIPHLIALRNIFENDNLAMLAISNEHPSKVKTFAKTRKMNYTVLHDKGDLPEPFARIPTIPTSFFIDTEGKIKFATRGKLHLAEIKAIIQAPSL